jgi:hypothetical protein
MLGSRAMATASSTNGKRTPRGVANGVGTPKAITACLEPARSASLASPATRKTPESRSLAISIKMSIMSLSFS